MSALPSPHVRNIVTSHEEPGWKYGYATSPYFEFDCARNATYLVYNGRLMPISFADSDRFEDYWALCDTTPRWFPRASCRPRSGVLLSISAVWNRLCSHGGPGARAGRTDRDHGRGRKDVPGGVRRTPLLRPGEEDPARARVHDPVAGLTRSAGVTREPRAAVRPAPRAARRREPARWPVQTRSPASAGGPSARPRSRRG